MKKRIRMGVVAPGAYTAMNALDKFVTGSSVERNYLELIKLRASQINGCGYCVDSHSYDAIKMGVPLQKILLVSAWKEAGEIFSEAEKLIFRMTEEITLIHQHGLTDEVYENAINVFGEAKTAQIIMSIVTINAWNRIGVATELHPAIRSEQLVSNN